MHLCFTVECISSGLHLSVFLIRSPPRPVGNPPTHPRVENSLPKRRLGTHTRKYQPVYSFKPLRYPHPLSLWTPPPPHPNF